MLRPQCSVPEGERGLRKQRAEAEVPTGQGNGSFQGNLARCGEKATGIQVRVNDCLSIRAALLRKALAWLTLGLLLRVCTC